MFSFLFPRFSDRIFRPNSTVAHTPPSVAAGTRGPARRRGNMAATCLGAAVTVIMAGTSTRPMLAQGSTGSLPPGAYGARAREVAEEIQKDFWSPRTNRYVAKPGEDKPGTAWDCGVMFSALVGAARNDPGRYQPLLKSYFDGLNGYWDRKQPLGGYEPLPTDGNGDDKYYDDNEWLAIAFLEAYELTGRQPYLERARETVKFVLSGWDETFLGGGVWWHESREKKAHCKNTCANGPASVACLRLARFSPPIEAHDLTAMAQKILSWTNANLQASDGLFADSKDLANGTRNEAKLTYNSALMLRANLGLYRLTGSSSYLFEAQRIARAATSLLDSKTGVYRDQVKWSHLMVEADLALYRTTGESYLLQRAKTQADAFYRRWKTEGPVDLITVASVSRVLWLMADMETRRGIDFWQNADSAVPRFPL